MRNLSDDYTIIIVTHNMQQAARVSDRTAFFTAELDDEGVRHGRLVEYAVTNKIFTAPNDPRTEAYVSGRFG
jgi:phosphate transport system ATP-binding protein